MVSLGVSRYRFFFFWGGGVIISRACWGLVYNYGVASELNTEWGLVLLGVGLRVRGLGFGAWG